MPFHSNNPAVSHADINFVLIHGLDGGRNSFTNPHSGKQMQDCLRAAFPRSKITTYVYPNGSVKSITSQHPLPIPERAEDFLPGLCGQLDDNDTSIHFVCHSMGGLILKEALLASSNTPLDFDEYDEISLSKRMRSVYERTRTISFYATPHLGSALARVLNTLQKSANLCLTNDVIKELEDDNPFLVRQKREFQQLIAKGSNQNIRVLSLTEQQCVPVLGAKVVEHESAVCDLGARYERVIKLDYNHMDICKPRYIKDRRFLELAHFVAERVPLIDAYSRLQSKLDDDDDKKADDDTFDDDTFDIDGDGVVYFDPSHDQTDDVRAARDAYAENPCMASMTSVFSAIVSSDSRNFKSMQLSKMLKGKVMEQNQKLLETLLNTQDFIDFVGAEVDQVKKSIELSTRYWSLLKESKQIITDQESRIVKLLRASGHWKVIIDKRIAYEDGKGPPPSARDGAFMKKLQRALKQYFGADTAATKRLEAKWSALHSNLKEMYHWWQQKYASFSEWKQSEWKKVKDAVTDKWWWIELVGKVVMYIGAAVTVVAGVCLVVTCTGQPGMFNDMAKAAFGYATGVGGVIGVGGCVVKSVANSKKRQLEEERQAVEKLERNVNTVAEEFKAMVKDSAEMDMLINDFVTALIRPKDCAAEIEEDMQDEIISWDYIKGNVEQIIDSLSEVKGVCGSLMQQISASQKNFY